MEAEIDGDDGNREGKRGQPEAVAEASAAAVVIRVDDATARCQNKESSLSLSAWCHTYGMGFGE